MKERPIVGSTILTTTPIFAKRRDNVAIGDYNLQFVSHKRTHVVELIGMRPRMPSFSFVFILPRSAKYTKNSMRGGTRPRQMPLITSCIGCRELFASSIQRDLTENSPVLWGFHERESSSYGYRWTLSSLRRSWSLSSMSRDLSGLLQVKHHNQFWPSHTPYDATVARWFVASLKSLGKDSFRGNSPTHISCQNNVFWPLPTRLRIFSLMIDFVSVCLSMEAQIFLHGPPVVGTNNSWMLKAGEREYLLVTTFLHSEFGSLK